MQKVIPYVIGSKPIAARELIFFLSKEQHIFVLKQTNLFNNT